MCCATFWAIFGGLWATFSQTSGHPVCVFNRKIIAFDEIYLEQKFIFRTKIHI
jgi:hypothetical protein